MHTSGIFHLQTENEKELHNQKHKSPGKKKKEEPKACLVPGHPEQHQAVCAVG